MIPFENIWVLWFIPLLFIFLMVLINHNFIAGNKNRKLRSFVIVLRFLSISILILVISAPYISHVTEKQGDTSVNVLIDASDSMQLFRDDTDAIISGLSSLDNVNVIQVGNGIKSPIGSVMLNNLIGDDNILLYSDGNENSGKTLQSVLNFASQINSTVNAISLHPEKNDASISIIAPEMVLAGLANDFYIVIDDVSDTNYEAVITLDGKEIKRISGSGPKVDIVSLSLNPGTHKMVAKLNVNDHFSQNNIFYKSINSIERPDVYYLSSTSTPAKELFSNIFSLDSGSELPSDLGKYFGIIIDDVSANSLDQYTERLSNYLLEGNGMMVIGGKNSFDKGNYQTSQFQTLLPVKVGSPVADNVTDLNVVILIDISISSGLGTGGGSVVDIEKAQAVEVFNQLEPEDNLGVIAFNNEGHVIAPLSKVKDQLNTPQKIYSLQDTGGTYLENGLLEAANMLEYAEGNKNIIIISDGKTKNPEVALEMTRNLNMAGVNIYAVGVGPGTDDEYMQRLAFAGGGMFFSAGVKNQITLMFGKERDVPKKEWSIKAVNQNHFISRGLNLNAKISGYNQVVSKSGSSQLLAATTNGIPVLTSWRFGLGRVVALSTDGGTAWAGQLLNKDNSKLLSRASTWAVGDPRRRQGSRITIPDGYIAEKLEVRIYSEKTPFIDDLQLSEVDTNIYAGHFIPDSAGFFEIMDHTFAVNYPREYKDIGLSPELKNIVTVTGGSMLDPNDIDKIIEKVKKDSIDIKEERQYFRWVLLPLAGLIFLGEILIRRIIKKRMRG